MIKKNTFLVSFSILLSLSLGACSSGSSISNAPPNVNGAPYTGTYQNNTGSERGTITLNLTQNDTTIGGLLFVNGGENACIRSGSVSGELIGFSVNLTVAQRTSESSEDADGNTTTSGGGDLKLTLNATNSSLTGNYTIEGDLNEGCNEAQSTGSIDATR